MQTNNFDKNMPEEEMEIQLWAYIDEQQTGPQRSATELLIAENNLWKEKYSQLLQVHQSLNLVEMEEPSLRFTRNVMEEIARLQITPATKQYINSKVIWGIAAFFITVITGFLIYAIAQIDWSAPGQVNSGVLDKISTADYSKIFSNTFVNAFMVVNVLLGLTLFDRYLNNKKKAFME